MVQRGGKIPHAHPEGPGNLTDVFLMVEAILGLILQLSAASSTHVGSYHLKHPASLGSLIFFAGISDFCLIVAMK